MVPREPSQASQKTYVRRRARRHQAQAWRSHGRVAFSSSQARGLSVVQSPVRTADGLAVFPAGDRGAQRRDRLAPILRERRTLPVVLTREEVARVIAAAPGSKIPHGSERRLWCRLRASEVVALKISDIRARRCQYRPRQGTQGPQGQALSPQLLGVLRDWYRVTRPARVWLFPSRLGAFDHI